MQDFFLDIVKVFFNKNHKKKQYVLQITQKLQQLKQVYEKSLLFTIVFFLSRVDFYKFTFSVCKKNKCFIIKHKKTYATFCPQSFI